jgi:hypothetical protein
MAYARQASFAIRRPTDRLPVHRQIQAERITSYVRAFDCGPRCERPEGSEGQDRSPARKSWTLDVVNAVRQGEAEGSASLNQVLPVAA